MDKKFLSTNSASEDVTILKSPYELENISQKFNGQKKFIVTLKPLFAFTNSQEETSPKLRAKKFMMHNKKTKSEFDTKFMPKSIPIDKIKENLRYRSTSLESKNYDLKVKQSTTDILRLSGGWGLKNGDERDGDKLFSTNMSEKKQMKTGKPKDRETFGNTDDISEYKNNHMKETLDSVKNPNDLFNISCEDNEISKRIEHLEKQLYEMHLECKELQKDILPAVDFAKFQLYSKHFQEIGNLLNELKINCLQLYNIEFPVGSKMPPNKSENKSVKENLSCNGECSFKDYQIGLADHHKYLESCNCETAKNILQLYTGNKTFSLDPVPNSSIHHMHSVTKDSLSFSKDIKGFGNACNCIKYIQNIQQPTSFGLSTQKAQPTVFTFDENVPDILFRSATHGISKAEEVKATDMSSPKAEDPSTKTDETKPSQSKKPKPSNCIPYQKTFSSTSFYEKTFEKSKNESNNCFHKSDEKEFPPHEIQNGNKRKISSDTSAADAISYCTYCQKLPKTTQNLNEAIWELVGNELSNDISLTIFMESNNLYHINVSAIKTGKCLGCIYTNETAFEQAKTSTLFENFLLLFVLNSCNSAEERDKILSHSFEFMNRLRH